MFREKTPQMPDCPTAALCLHFHSESDRFTSPLAIKRFKIKVLKQAPAANFRHLSLNKSNEKEEKERRKVGEKDEEAQRRGKGGGKEEREEAERERGKGREGKGLYFEPTLSALSC